MNLSSKEESGKKKKKGQSLRARGRRLHQDRRREEGSRSEKVLRDAVARNLPSLTKDVKLQVQETKRASRRISGQQSTLHHIIIKCLKSKQRRRFLEAERDGLPRGERGWEWRPTPHQKPRGRQDVAPCSPRAGGKSPWARALCWAEISSEGEWKRKTFSPEE